MAWWLWYVPVVAMSVLAYAGYRIASRPRGRQEPADSVQAYERFRQAMATPVPPARKPPRRQAHQAGQAPVKR